MVARHIHHEALIAVHPETGQSFGTARYVRDDADPSTAEFAVGVGDEWMRIGLGSALRPDARASTSRRCQSLRV